MAVAYGESSVVQSQRRAQAWKSDASDGAPDNPNGERSERRQRCDKSLRAFLEEMFPAVFVLAWSPDHLDIIERIQHHVVEGGLKSIAAPRGSGKTSIMLRAALWAILTGNRKFVCCVAANEESAVEDLQTIKTEIDFNENLLAEYGWETWCLRQVAGSPMRAKLQTYEGQRTGTVYGQRQLGFGTIDGSITNGAVISTAGITGRIRGQQVTTLSGEVIRPDFVLVDDPQTKSSASSPAQCKKRHEIMMGDVLGLAGPGVKISGFCTCTVIYQCDLADTLLDRKLSADWNGEKISMIKQWPKDIDGWDEYNILRIEELTANEPHVKSLDFVRKHYERLHNGSEVYWEERKGEKDVSALQHAMDLYYRDQGVFAAEFQNKPMSEFAKSPYDINIDNLCRRVVGFPRGRVPNDVDKVTAFIDVQRELLYYLVVAWSHSGRAYIIDYGSCPDQKRHYWTKATIGYGLAEIYGDDFETYLRGGLTWLTDAILDNDYTTEDGGQIQVDRLCIDARWGESTHIIRRFVRESKNRARMHPSMGMYIGATSRPWQKLTGDKKDKKGVHAKLQTPKEAGKRELLYDTNYWKSFAASRLLCAAGSPKAIVLFDDKPHHHRMFAEHCAWEEPLRVIGKTNNEVVEWKQRKIGGATENDYWDCLVGNCALASTLGVETHSGNKRSNRGMSEAMKRILKSKPRDQFFQG